jgi:DNA-binding MarR family transcriptional regulator
MAVPKSDLLQGTLDLIILRTLAEWGVSENNRQARFYSLTKKGRRQLEDETANWTRFAGAVARILEQA